MSHCTLTQQYNPITVQISVSRFDLLVPRSPTAEDNRRSNRYILPFFYATAYSFVSYYSRLNLKGITKAVWCHEQLDNSSTDVVVALWTVLLVLCLTCCSSSPLLQSSATCLNESDVSGDEWENIGDLQLHISDSHGLICCLLFHTHGWTE